MKKLRIILGLALALLLIAGPVFAADQTIAATEEMVGSGHATKTDTLNRHGLVEHNTDGTHKAAITGLSVTAGKTITATQDTSLDEAVAMSSKAPKASPVFTGDVTLAGKVVNTTLPAFLVRPTAAQLNIAINTMTTVIWGTEIKDQGGNFASNTFTAPVTGLYQLSVQLALLEVDSAVSNLVMGVFTSNRTYYQSLDMTRFSADIGQWCLSLSVLTDMDAGDTVYVGIYQLNGTQQMDVGTESFFSGYLVC